MILRAKIIDLIRKLDRCSTYPLFYPFVMSNNEKSFFDETIKRARHYLEFGFGGSTLRAILKSKAKIYTVESSLEWINQMRKYRIIQSVENKRLYIFYINIGPTGDWGFPKSVNNQNLFETYSSAVFKKIDSSVLDLVLIDGRFRVACTLKTILSCYENTNLKIMIHDFWNREQYHVVLKYLDLFKRVDSLGIFTIKKGINLALVNHDYELYKLDPQ